MNEKMNKYEKNKLKESQDAYFKEELPILKRDLNSKKIAYEKEHEKVEEVFQQHTSQLTEGLNEINTKIDKEWLPAVQKKSPQRTIENILNEVNEQIHSHAFELDKLSTNQKASAENNRVATSYLRVYFKYVLVKLMNVKVLAERKINKWLFW